MPEPTVCAILLTRDRPEYARRAVECFRRQTYERKYIRVLDTSEQFNPNLAGWHFESPVHGGDKDYIHAPHLRDLTIGALRNMIIGEHSPEIIVHLDDDDYSHPARIAEQVALLQASGADCVGYSEMLFWRQVPSCVQPHGSALLEAVKEVTDRVVNRMFGEAYLYTNTDPTFCLGTSMCYWRKSWERQPFSESNGPNPRERGEDREFLRGIKSVGLSSITADGHFKSDPDKWPVRIPIEPRMIARIHAGNARHYPEDLLRNSTSWRRVPEWDAKCRSIMEEA